MRSPKQNGKLDGPPVDPLGPLARALAPLVAAELVRLGAVETAAPRWHSQLDGERPVGVSRVQYLRTWRALAAAGDTETRAEGRARLMSPGAWARGRALLNAGAKPRPPKLDPVDPDADALAALGLRRVS
jgi:hypothetical protein